MQATDNREYQLIHLTAEGKEMWGLIEKWIQGGTPLLWFPIFDQDNFPGATQDMLAHASEMDGACWVITEHAHFMNLPAGIRGWLKPIKAEDTDIVCGRWENRVTVMTMKDARTNKIVTFQTDQP